MIKDFRTYLTQTVFLFFIVYYILRSIDDIGGNYTYLAFSLVLALIANLVMYLIEKRNLKPSIIKGGIIWKLGQKRVQKYSSFTMLLIFETLLIFESFINHLSRTVFVGIILLAILSSSILLANDPKEVK